LSIRIGNDVTHRLIGNRTGGIRTPIAATTTATTTTPAIFTLFGTYFA
jgi:hypothetical protein